MESESMKKRIIKIALSLIALAVIFAGESSHAETILGPDITVKIYFDAYVAQDWEVCTAYLHPEFLENLKTSIIDMLLEISDKRRKDMLSQFHAQSIEELDKMPSRQMYILYLQYRWRALDAVSGGLDNAELSFINTRKISSDECIVEFKSSVKQGHQLFSKVEIYYLKKDEGRWKIYNTDGFKKLRGL